MKIKRIHGLMAFLALALCAIPFRDTILRSAMALVSPLRSRKTVSDRVLEFGSAVRSRLTPGFTQVNVSYPPKQIVLLGLKEERLLEVWVSDGVSGLKHLKTYPILAASGKMGPKLAEGDLQVPEGIYKIESLNPNSSFHLSLRVNYPNSFDREQARLEGRENPGSDIMIHGKAVSIGCVAIGDQAAEELFVLVAETGVEKVQLILSPIDLRKRTLPTNLRTLPAWTPDLYASIQKEMKKLSATGSPKTD